MRARMAGFFAFVVMVLALLLAQSAGVKAGQAGGSMAKEMAPTITITRARDIPSSQGAAERFTGAVTLDMMTEPKEPGKPRVQSVTFKPGAHTAWHSHPLGQILVVTSGSGFIQEWAGPIQQIHQGDVIWTPANVKHWHGAGPNGPMTHISVYEEPSGQVTKWMEKVSDEQYRTAH